MQSFNEQQVGAILKRASELQTGDADARPGLTLEELRSIAEEVGIDPRFVEQAVHEAQRPARQRPGFSFFGTPARLTEERVLAHPVDEEEWDGMVEELRRTYGQVGTVTGAGHTRSWSFGDRRSPAVVTVSLTRRRGRTFLTMQRNLHKEIAVTFGPASSPIIVFTVLLATGQLLPLGVALSLLSALLLLLTGFFALRAVAGHIGRKEEQKMSDVLDRLESLAGESEALPEAPAAVPLPAAPRLDLGLDAGEAPEATPASRRARTR